MIKKNASILVTGAAGLAGSAVVEYLRSKQYTCVIPITRADCDLTNPAQTNELFERIRPQYVFHAAAVVYGLGGNMANQAKSSYENTLINTNVIHGSRHAKKIIAMGTNAIYPAPPVLPYREDNIFDGRPHHGEHAYGNAKRHMLAMLEAYEESYLLPYCYLVSGNLYGPNDRFDPAFGHVLPSLIWKFHQASKLGGEVSIWGDGSPRRDFLFSHDLARIVELVLTTDTRGPINIGSGEVHSIRATTDILCNVTGIGNDRVVFDPSKPNGRLDCTSDLTRLTDLGFRREHSLVRGLTETWKWYCHEQSSSNPVR